MKKKKERETGKVEVQHPRVLAIDPTVRGFGYAVFDAPQRLIDWGVVTSKMRKVTESLLKFEQLLAYYKPNIVVIENVSSDKSRRGTTAKKISNAFTRRCAVAVIPVRRMSVDNVKDLFREFDALTKEEIADHLIQWLPMLEMDRPPRRAIWDSEDERMSIFDAASMAITYYAEDKTKNKDK